MERFLSTALRTILAEAFRRYFVNTVFDSTFVIMGIVIGSALVPGSSLRTVVGTMLGASLALGISTGTSVYEAERVESEIRLRELEEAMLIPLADTDAMRALNISRYVVVAVNVAAPMVVFALTSAPFFLMSGSFPPAYVSVGIAILILFSMGAYLGKLSGGRIWLKGLRMAVLGLITFGAIWAIQTFLF